MACRAGSCAAAINNATAPSEMPHPPITSSFVRAVHPRMALGKSISRHHHDGITLALAWLTVASHFHHRTGFETLICRWQCERGSCPLLISQYRFRKVTYVVRTMRPPTRCNVAFCSPIDTANSLFAEHAIQCSAKRLL